MSLLANRMTIMMILNSNGWFDSHNNYNSFGETMRSQVNSGPDDRYGFTSKELAAETGLYHLGARSYDPWGGRFLSVDPMASDSTLAPWSPYQYSFDNPVRFKDPTGKWPGFLDQFVSSVQNWISNEFTGAENAIIAAMNYHNPDIQEGEPQSGYQNSNLGLPSQSKVNKVEFQAASHFLYATAKGQLLATGETLSLAATGGAFEGAPLELTGSLVFAKTAVNASYNVLTGKSIVFPVATAELSLALPFTPVREYAKAFSTASSLYGLYNLYHQGGN